MTPISFTLGPNDRVIGVANMPFDRLGLEGLLPHYGILTGQWDEWMTALASDGIKVLPLIEEGTTNESTLSTTRQLLESPRCLPTLREYCPAGGKCYVLVYKNDAGITKAAQRLPIYLLANDYRRRERLENKATMREGVGRRLPLPPHEIVPSANLVAGAAGYTRWQRQWSLFVMQDERLSGGKGTFIVRDVADYTKAVAYLGQYPRHRVVISQYIPGDVSSIQVCFTRYGSFSSPIQQQLVGQPELAHRPPGFEQFCGGQWNMQPRSAAVANQIAAIVATLEQELQGEWRGILGVDVIVDPDDTVWVIEINARLTGLTPPLAMLQREVSPLNFLLLHTLELADISYTLADPPELVRQWSALPAASYVLPHNRLDHSVARKEDFPAGVYKITPGGLAFERPGWTLRHLQSAEEIVIPDVPDRGRVIKPGGRLPRILSRQAALDDAGHLMPSLKQAVSYVEGKFGATRQEKRGPAGF